MLKNMHLLLSRAEDKINDQELTLPERFAVATRPCGRGANRKERAGLQDKVELAIGMKVMVTWNVFTELDVANGTRGKITDIIHATSS